VAGHSTESSVLSERSESKGASRSTMTYFAGAPARQSSHARRQSRRSRGRNASCRSEAKADHHPIHSLSSYREPASCRRTRSWRSPSPALSRARTHVSGAVQRACRGQSVRQSI